MAIAIIVWLMLVNLLTQTCPRTFQQTRDLGLYFVQPKANIVNISLILELHTSESCGREEVLEAWYFQEPLIIGTHHEGHC